MKVKELLLTGLLVLLCAMPNVAMAADTTVTRSYPFESATQENPHYTVPETVEEGGKTYTLTSVEYEMKAHREPVTVVRTIGHRRSRRLPEANHRDGRRHQPHPDGADPHMGHRREPDGDAGIRIGVGGAAEPDGGRRPPAAGIGDSRYKDGGIFRSGCVSDLQSRQQAVCHW